MVCAHDDGDSHGVCEDDVNAVDVYNESVFSHYDAYFDDYGYADVYNCDGDSHGDDEECDDDVDYDESTNDDAV